MQKLTKPTDAIVRSEKYLLMFIVWPFKVIRESPSHSAFS
jgi:hypothetical protein